MGLQKIKKKTPQLKKYAITYPRCPLDKKQAIQQLSKLPEILSIIVSQEKHQEKASQDSQTDSSQTSSTDQTPTTHLHCYVRFATSLRRDTKSFELTTTSGCKIHGNVKPCTNIRQWVTYITKEDKTPETLNFNLAQWNKKQNPSKTVSRLAEMTIAELGEEIHPKDLQRTIAGINLYKALTREVEDLKGPCGIWIRGDAGIGKSYETRRFCIENKISYYLKTRNKWWDTYKGEDVVIIDDIAEPDKTWLTPYLKIWADAYAFDGETKGGTIKLRPKWIIVTANYSVEDFVTNMQDLQPMRRRFVESDWLTEQDQTTSFLTETVWAHQPEVPEVPAIDQ